MNRIDELYLARMEAESLEQELWERTRAEPGNFAVLAAHRDAVATAEAAGSAYLGALLEAEGRRQRMHLVAV